MGKALVRLGLWMQRTFAKLKCNWNWLISKIMFKVAEECPHKVCTCKK